MDDKHDLMLLKMREDLLVKVSKIEDLLSPQAKAKLFSANNISNINNDISNPIIGGVESLNDANKIEIIYDGYNTKWNLTDKTFFILKHEKRFLHSREIAELIVKFDGGSVDEIVSKLSPMLSRFKASGELINIREGASKKNVYWGSPNWLNEDGSIKDEHKFTSQNNGIKRLVL